jgi:gliding motility-associated-like protein
VVEYPRPNAIFTVSDYTLDSKHNELSCSLPNQTGVQYVWDMGDGLSETGTTVQHTYNITQGVFAYTVTLTATSNDGCADSSSEIIEVNPFVPNVFSPNDDGINDVFMPDIDLEVIDRNGLLLYKGTAGWDGRYKGQPVDPDTYFYQIRYPNRYQQMHTRKGFITLVR